MRSCPLFEHLLSPSLNNSIFQIPAKHENCMEEKYFHVRRIDVVQGLLIDIIRPIMNLNEVSLLKRLQ